MPNSEPQTPTEDARGIAAIVNDVAAYYDAKVMAHGPTPRGVDWNSSDSQTRRFEELLKLCRTTDGVVELTDYGCGYGALMTVLAERGWTVSYQGFDVAPGMISRARELWRNDPRVALKENASHLTITDYTVASGLFNVKLDTDPNRWEQYICHTLDHMATISRRGFAFNILSTYSDPDRRRADLYYADPLMWFRHCHSRYSPHVALLHDYGLYEFTMHIRFEGGP